MWERVSVVHGFQVVGVCWEEKVQKNGNFTRHHISFCRLSRSPEAAKLATRRLDITLIRDEHQFHWTSENSPSVGCD